MVLNLINTIVKCLQVNVGEQLTARQIAEWIFENYPKESREKQERSRAKVKPLITTNDLIRQIEREIIALFPRLKRMYPNLSMTGEKPRKLSFTHVTEDVSEVVTFLDKEYLNSEQRLYPILMNYLSITLGIDSKIIYKNKINPDLGLIGNSWLYPDIIGAKLHNSENNSLVTGTKEDKYIYYAFELQLSINVSSVREIYFQTLSNCGWANYGYLVITDIIQKNVLNDLILLNELYGIGLIKFVPNDFSKSKILIEAKGDFYNKKSFTAFIKNNEIFSDFIDYISE
jgi:hypothetical protein